MIIGARSRTEALPAAQPKRAWVEDLTANARAVGASVFHKANLTVLSEERLVECPEGEEVRV